MTSSRARPEPGASGTDGRAALCRGRAENTRLLGFRPVPPARRPGRSRALPAAAGFTLVEILLVVAIIAVSLGVAVPQFAKSFRGARLRQSARTVESMHRQAKARAVLDQSHAALFFDAVKGTVELVVLQENGGGHDVFFGDAPVAAAGGTGGDAAEGDGEGTVKTQSELTMTLEEGVKIEDFRGGSEVDEVYYVQYFPSGMCQEWSLHLGDEEGRRMSISVDPVTGKIESEQEN